MIDRYARQALFAGIGEEGQARIGRSRVLVAGCGALGTHIADSLARAGVGHLKLVDRDFVEESNLQRQILFDEADAREGLPKAVAAQRKLQAVNSRIVIQGIVADLTGRNVEGLLEGVDLVMDGTDNFESRYLLNDACVRSGIPWIYGACVGGQGLAMAVLPGETPCLRCVFEAPPPAELNPTCETAGVIAPVVAAVAAFQVAEALKLLAGRREALLGGLVSLDIWEGSFRLLRTGKGRGRDDCPTCVRRSFDYLDGREGSHASLLCGRDAVQVTPPAGGEPDLAALARRLERLGPVRRSDFLLRFEAMGCEVTLFADGRAIVKGTQDASVARGIYVKYIGG